MPEYIKTIATDTLGKCQVFTPPDMVQRVLDMAGYVGNVAGRRILENSCGKGDFLCEIARRYIAGARAAGYSNYQILCGLRRDIVGIDIDGGLLAVARQRLDSVAAEFGIESVDWDLRNSDALFVEIPESFDYIVGNPPYLEYGDIGADLRDRIRDRYSFCKKGKFDYCYAFVELGLCKLKPSGVLVQIVPNSILKNASGELLRSGILDYLTEVVSYAGMRAFKEALVTPCIIKCENGEKRSTLSFTKWNEDGGISVEKRGLDNKWSFARRTLFQGGNRFGNVFRARMPVATLCNDAFLVEDGEVEDLIVREAACPHELRASKTRHVIFPYMVSSGGEIIRFVERDLKNDYPRAYARLSNYKDALRSRKADASAQWFEYGRNQGLSIVPKRKLLLSTVVTGAVHVYELNSGVVPYGGIVVTCESASHDLDYAKGLLESNRFFEYARAVGTNISGSSVRITCRDINDFRY